MGTRTATAEVALKMQLTAINTLLDGSTASSIVGGQLIRQTLANGVNANQINRIWKMTGIEISDGGFTDFNISTMAGKDIGAGAGKDALGQTVDIEELVMLLVVNNGTGILEIQATVPGAAAIVWMAGGAAADSNGGGIREGGFRMWYEPSEIGLDLVSGSSAVLRLSAASGGGAVDDAHIYILGRNDDNESSSSSVSSSSSSSSSSSTSS